MALETKVEGKFDIIQLAPYGEVIRPGKKCKDYGCVCFSDNGCVWSTKNAKPYMLIVAISKAKVLFGVAKAFASAKPNIALMCVFCRGGVR